MTNINNPAQGRFTQGSIMRHVVVMTLTSGLGLTFTFAIDFITLFWLAQLNDQALKASVSIAGAVAFSTISLSVAMMIATIPLVARNIGRGKRGEAREAATAGLTISLIFQITLVALLLIFLRPVVSQLGAGSSDAANDYAYVYLLISMPSLPFMSVGMICAGILRAEGDGVRSMYVTLAAGIVAMVLDPLFIIVFGLGNEGAAIVQVIARFSMMAAGLYFVIVKYDLLAPLRGLNFRPWIAPFVAIAAPVLLTQLSAPTGNIILTRYMSQFGDAALEGWAVNFRLLLLAFGGVFALSGAIGGIIGQNYGAGNLGRVQESYIKAIRFGAIYTLIAWTALMLLRPFVQTIFKLDPESIPIVNAFVHTSWYFIFVSALYVSNAAFNNLGRPIWSTGVNWMRDVVLTVPAVIVLSQSMGAVGVVYSQVISGIIAGTAAGFIGWRYLKAIADGTATVERVRV